MKTDMKFHKNGKVTFWNIYNQVWECVYAHALFQSDRLMATLSDNERMRVEAHSNGMTLTRATLLARFIWECGDDNTGMIDSFDDLVSIFGRSDPTLHNPMLMSTAAKRAGCYYCLESMIDA